MQDTSKAYQIFQLLRFVATIIAGVLLVKAEYSDDYVANFEWFLFVANSVSFFWSLGLRNAMLNFFPKLSTQQQSNAFQAVFLLFCGFSAVAGLFLLAVFQDWAGSASEHRMLFILFLLLSIPSTLIEQAYILRSKGKALVIYGIAYFLGYVAIFVYAYFQSISMELLLKLLCVWAAGRFLFAVIEFFTFKSFRPDFAVVKPFLFFGLPLIVHVLLGNGMEYIDGFLVKYFFEIDQFAVFRYGARELPINTILVSALATATIPLATLNLNASLSTLKAKVNRLMPWLFGLSIVLFYLSPFLFAFVYDDFYKPSAAIFNIYLLILSSRILLPQVVIYAKQKNGFLAVATGVEVVINLVLSIVLVQFFGIAGICFATVIAFFVQKLILVYYTKNYLGVSVHEYLNVKSYLFWVILMYSNFTFSYLFFDF